MTTEVIVRPEQALAARFANSEEVRVLRETLVPGVPDMEFTLFTHVCKHLALDPWAKQIYAVMRGGKMTIQTSIDGYRLIAHRTGQHAGTDDALFEENGALPSKATVTVWKMVDGQRVPFTASARWAEYKQDAGGMWRKMPFTMLGKCAEALALRKAFPSELSDIYTEDEMAQADNPAYDAPEPVSPARRDAREALRSGGASAETRAQQREQAKQHSVGDDGLPPSLSDIAYAKNIAGREQQADAPPPAEWFEPLKDVMGKEGKKLSELSVILNRPASAKALRDWAAALPEDVDPYAEMLRACREHGIIPPLDIGAIVEAVDQETGEVVTVEGEVMPEGFVPVDEEDAVFE